MKKPRISRLPQFADFHPNTCELHQNSRGLSSSSQRFGLDTDPLLAEDIQHELRRTVVLVHGLVRLESLHILDILVEEVAAVHWATPSLRMELGGEDRPRGMTHTFVAPVVKIHEVLFPITGKGAGINGVPMVLASDMTLSRRHVKGWDVVRSVAILELNGTSSCCEG